MRLRATKLAAIGFGGARLPLPSLDLQFATDKTLTARKGPTPAFTRATGATQVNAAGLIEYAPENSVPNSTLVYQPSAYFTVASTGLIDPDGAAVSQLTATAFGGQSRTEVTGALANVRTFYSVWVKLKEGNTPPAFLHLVVGDGPMAGFNTSTWSITNAGGGVGSVEYGNDGWVKLKLTFQPNLTTSTTYKLVATDANNYGLTVTAGRVFYVGSRNVSRNSFNHIQTTGTPFYAPRFDHDPVTLACKGLLIEEQRTNLLLHSENFKNTTSSNYWENLSATTVTVDQIASPDGGVNADLLTTSTASFDCFVRRTGIFTGSTQYTYSIFLKQGPSGYRYVGLYIGAGVSALKFPFFDFNNPTTVQIPSGTMVGTINSTRVDAYPNGWYRVSVTFTTAATLVTTLCGVYISQSDGTIPASSAAGLNAYIWGIQVELGSFPTSYIPTAAASVFRSADVCSITGSDFTGFYNGLEGTIISDGSIASIAGNNRGMWAINNSTSAHGFLTYYDAATPGISSQSRNTGSTTLTPNFLNSANTLFKRALAYRTGQASICTNGSSVTATNVTISTQTMLTLQVGNMLAGSFYWSGHIAAIRYYKKRLPNAKLQSLTT